MNRFQQSPKLKKLVRKENKCAKYGKTEEKNGEKKLVDKLNFKGI